MKSYIYIILYLFISPLVLAQNESTIYPGLKSVRLEEYENVIDIQYDFGANSMTQNHFNLSSFKNPNFKWNEFLSYAFGKTMDPIHEEVTNKVGDKLFEYARGHNLNGDDLLALIISFTNALVSEDTNSSGYFYYPYEIFINGVRDSSDRMTVFASLLSSFCFDIGIGIFDGGFMVSVLAEDGEVSFADNEYKALRDYKGDQSIRVAKFEERCKYKSTPFEPVMEIQTATLQEYNSFLDESFRIAMDASEGQMHMSINNYGSLNGPYRASNQPKTRAVKKEYVFDVVDGKIKCVRKKAY